MDLESSSFVAVTELIDALSEHAVQMDCSQGRTLFRQGDSPVGLFIVHSGTVTVSMQNNAGITILSFAAQPGSLLGLPAVVSNAPYSLSAEADRGAQVSIVPHKHFASIMLIKLGVAIRVLQVLAAEVRAVRSLIAARQ